MIKYLLKFARRICLADNLLLLLESSLPFKLPVFVKSLTFSVV